MNARRLRMLRLAGMAMVVVALAACTSQPKRTRLATLSPGRSVPESRPTAATYPGAPDLGRPAVVPGDATAELSPAVQLRALDEAEAALSPDYLKPWNLVWFYVNDKLYFWVFKPIGTAWAWAVPEPVRIGIRNAFDNIEMPVRLVGCLLQGKLDGAGRELSRFGLNTTLGVLGFWDIAADPFEIEPQKEDFGQTLAVYGVPDIAYIVWPVLGPMTIRDTVGGVPDYFLKPSTYLWNAPWYIKATLNGVERVNGTSLILGKYELLKRSPDPYRAMRVRHLEKRQEAIEE